jgi:hypothetical protein
MKQLFAIEDSSELRRLGFRSGEKGTHTSRTIMLDELKTLFASVPAESARVTYVKAIIESNCLAKPTTATRRLSSQRLVELYGLDPDIPIFRVLRRLWDIDEAGRPLFAMLCSIARDPLLASSADAVLPLEPGAEFQRSSMNHAIRRSVGERLNDATVEKVVRNAASSWTQSGHFEGRTFKIRRSVQSTPATVAFALYLGYATEARGQELLSSSWIQVLDCSITSATQLALEAKRMGLIDMRSAGDVVEIGLDRLDPRGRK